MISFSLSLLDDAFLMWAIQLPFFYLKGNLYFCLPGIIIT